MVLPGGTTKALAAATSVLEARVVTSEPGGNPGSFTPSGAMLAKISNVLGMAFMKCEALDGRGMPKHAVIRILKEARHMHADT